MTRLLLAFVVMATLTLSLHAAEALEWLADLRVIGMSFGVTPGTTVSWINLVELKKIAAAPKTPADLDKALELLPTKERRDRAYKTLISFTVWQPPPGFTDEGMQHGMPPLAK